MSMVDIPQFEKFYIFSTKSYIQTLCYCDAAN